MNIKEFLEARIAEDEAQAAKHIPALSSHGLGDYGLRVLAECGAKRAIIKEWEDPATLQDYDREGAFYAAAITQALECLAATYADHSDYQQEWSA